MEKITIQQARSIALTYLADMGRTDDLVLMPDKEREYPFGWVFFGAPRKYLETGDFRYQLPGMGPFVVELDGTVHPLSTSGSPDAVIAAYLHQWEGRRQH